jgi:hypothetical protein
MSKCKRGPPTKFLCTCAFKTIPVTPSLGAHLTCEFIKHVLFMRQQIPCTYLELEKLINKALEEKVRQKEVDEEALRSGTSAPCKKRKRLSAGFHKKMFKTYNDFQLLFQSISELFCEKKPTMVVIALGSSPSTAVEKFALHFGYPTETNEQLQQQQTSLTEHQLNLCTRKLIRSVFQNAGELFQTRVRPTKLFVIARSPPFEDIGKSLFVVDWNLNPLKRRKGKTGISTWIIKIRGLGSNTLEDENEEIEQSGKIEEEKDKGSEGGKSECTFEGKNHSVQSVPIMSLDDDPMLFAAAAPKVNGVPKSLLPPMNQIEVWCKYPKGIKSLKGPRGGF